MEQGEVSSKCEIPVCPKCENTKCSCELGIGGLPPWYCEDCD